MLSRRSVLQASAALPLLLKTSFSDAAERPDAALKSLTAGARPIGVEERRTRIAKVQELLGRAKLGALLIEPGSSLEYFTGIQWRRSERTTAALIL